VKKSRKKHIRHGLEMERILSPYDLACNVSLLVAYSAALVYSVNMQCKYFKRSRFIQMIQYLSTFFYSCSC
jgi:hypothetical protein